MLNNTSKLLLEVTIRRIDGAYAPSTIRATKSNFEKFIEFCFNENVDALPADKIDLANYINHLANSNLK